MPEFKATLTETPLSNNQMIYRAEDGWVRIIATVPYSLMFWDWLRAFGHRAQLVSLASRVDALWDHDLAQPDH